MEAVLLFLVGLVAASLIAQIVLIALYLADKDVRDPYWRWKK